MNDSPEQPHRIVGVLLAAGRGRRMGRTKQLLPWRTNEGLKSLVAAAYDTIAFACDAMVVVLGHDAELVAAALGERSFERVMSDPGAPMFESIRVGLEAARATDPNADVLLHPSDHPDVRRDTVEVLRRARRERSERVFMPLYDNRGGHPVLIPAVLIDRLIAHSGEGGLREFWARHADLCVRIAVDDPGTVCDIDTPDQYGDGGRAVM
jgi:molybdenum cofactor cytidylyltransferase